MSAKLKRVAFPWGAPVLLGAVASLVGGHYLPESIAAQAAPQAATAPPVHFATVNVTLPPGEFTFPPSPGVEIANANCVMCHSPGIVLHQPPLTVSQWNTEIMRMRGAFGAPIPLDQIDALARYLGTIDGRKEQAGPSGVGDISKRPVKAC